MNEPALRLSAVSKSFHHFSSPLQRLREALWPSASRRFSIEVLKDISLTVARGESVAIIGANGVGKSTMLHLVAGLVEPTSGTVTVNGSVAALLDLGGGFLPELTGRENAQFYHRLVSRGDVDPAEREQLIEDFAGLGEFFDRPLRTYSSGMFLRLAFACATAEDPDIILIDEVLAVGDARFQQKCYRRLSELRTRGTTILLVTHMMHALTTIVDRVVVMEHGRIAYDGEPGGGVDRYFQLLFTAPESREGASAGELRYGFGGARISRVTAHNALGENATSFKAGDLARITFDVEFERDVERPDFGFTCATKEGTRLYTTSGGMLGLKPTPAAAGDRRSMEVVFRLNTAVVDVFIDLSVFEATGEVINVLDARIHVLHLSVAIPLHYVGIADVSAEMRVMP